jgi:hypothetical protein
MTRMTTKSGKRCGLPMINILKTDGTLNAEAGPYQGLIDQARRVSESSPIWTPSDLLGEIEDREIELPSQRSQQNRHRTAAGGPVVREDGRTGSVGDGRGGPMESGQDFPDALSQRVSRLARARNEIGRSVASFGGDIRSRFGQAEKLKR